MGLKIYIDTNIALDYATKRNSETMSFIDSVKKKKGEIVISSFLVMEMVDYKKNDIFIKKCLSKKWEVRKIIREINNQKGRGLDDADYSEIGTWQHSILKELTAFKIYDFIQNKTDWNLSQIVSISSDLSAPDALHLTSAIIGFLNQECNYMITNDSLLKKEGKMIIKNLGIENEFEILTVSQAKQKFFTK